MTPEQEKQFNEMEQRLRNIELAQNPDFIGSLENVQIIKRDDFNSTGLTGVVDTNINTRTTTQTVGAGGGTVTVTHLSAPDNFILYQYKGKTYQLWANNL